VKTQTLKSIFEVFPMTTTITIQKSELATATGIVQPFFIKKMPPLSCIQMRLKDKRLELFTSLGFEGGSAYAAIPASFNGKDMQRWQMLDAQAFVDVLSLCTNTLLELTFSETSLVIKDIGSCSTLKLLQSVGLAEDTFPRQDAIITLDGLSFAHMVRVGEAASDDIARATLTGIYLHADPAKSEITSVAADGFILSVATLAVKTNSASETMAGVYSADALARLVRATKPVKTDIISLAFRKAGMLVSISRDNCEAVFIIPMLGKDYVDFAQVLRASTPKGMKIVVQKKALESFLRRTRTISGALYLQAKGGYLWLLAEDEDKKIGRAVDSLPFEGDPKETSLVLAYGMNVLHQAIVSSIAQDEITITFPTGEKAAPAMVTGAFASVIAMPLARNPEEADPFKGLKVPQPVLLPA
jgi:DNA polymerase III sliding clamp (beta) subunit (PCNA family)